MGEKLVTLARAMDSFMDHLRRAGKKETTLYTYGQDAKLVNEFLGESKPLAELRPADVARFLKSDNLLKLSSGRGRAKPTVDKTIRFFRMFLIWAHASGRTDSLLIPEGMPVGRVKKEKAPKAPKAPKEPKAPKAAKPAKAEKTPEVKEEKAAQAEGEVPEDTGEAPDGGESMAAEAPETPAAE